MRVTTLPIVSDHTATFGDATISVTALDEYGNPVASVSRAGGIIRAILNFFVVIEKIHNTLWCH